jgi:hypothetical protein
MSGTGEGGVWSWLINREHRAGRCRYAVPRTVVEIFFCGHEFQLVDKIKEGGVRYQNPNIRLSGAGQAGPLRLLLTPPSNPTKKFEMA